MDNVFVYLVFLNIVVFNAFVNFVFRKNFFHPANFLFFYWSLFLVLDVLYSAIFGFIFYVDGFVVILFHILLFFGGGLAYLYSRASFLKSGGGCYYVLNYKFLRRAIVLFSILGSFSLYFLLNANGYSLKDMFFIENWFYMSHELSVARYELTANYPFAYKFFLSFIYAGALLSGILYVYKRSVIDYMYIFLPLLMSFMNAVVNGARAGFFISVFAFLASFISVMVLNNKKSTFSLISKEIVFFLIVMLFVLFLVQLLRGGGGADYASIFDHIIVYTLGSVNAFSIWWHESSLTSLGLGKYTFSGVYNLLFGGRELGLFSEPVLLSPGYKTNVFTVFRLLIEDYSVMGSLFLFFVLGYIFSYVYDRLQYSPILFVFLVAFYFVGFWSFVTNPFTYNTTILSFLFVLLIVKKIFKVKCVCDAPKSSESKYFVQCGKFYRCE